MTGIDITPDFAWLAIAAGPEPYFLLLAALVVDALVGLAWRARGRAFDRLAAQMLREPIRRLGRAERSAATHLIRGLVLALAALAVAGVAGAALGVAAAALPFGWALGLAVLLLVVDQRAIFATLGAALRAPPAVDDTALRQALESATLRYAEGVVALAFWYGLLGVAGLVMYRVVLVLALLFDRPGADDAGLGFVPLRLHEAAAWIPLCLAGLLVAFAALFTPGASFLGALAAMVGHSPGPPPAQRRLAGRGRRRRARHCARRPAPSRRAGARRQPMDHARERAPPGDVVRRAPLLLSSGSGLRAGRARGAACRDDRTGRARPRLAAP